jgi:hypothetical protein
MIADIGGSFREGQAMKKERDFSDTLGQVISNTPGYKYADLVKLDPQKAVAYAEALGIPRNETDRLQAAVGTITLTNRLLKSSNVDPSAVGALLLEQANFYGSQGISSQMLQKSAKAFMSGDPQQIEEERSAFNQMAAEFSTKKPERVKASEVINGMVITDDGNGNFSRTRVSAEQAPTEEALLKREEIRMRIEDRSAAAEAKRITAVEAAEQKDSKAVSSVFESQTALDNLDILLKDDAYKAIYGTGDAFLPTLRADSITLEAQRDQVVDLLGLESREKLKGSGTISDSESAALARSATILGNPGISEPAALIEINRVRDVFSRSRDRNLKNPEARRLLRESLIARDTPADGQGGAITSSQVKIPNGKVMTFGTPEEANAFRKQAGL